MTPRVRMVIAEGATEDAARAKLAQLTAQQQALGLEPDGPPERIYGVCNDSVRLAQVYRPRVGKSTVCAQYTVVVHALRLVLDAVDEEDASLQARAGLAWRCGHNQVPRDITCGQLPEEST